MTLKGEGHERLMAAIYEAVKHGMTFEAWWDTDFEWTIKFTGGY